MPNYPLVQLTTVADCDAALDIARNEQKDLEWKKLSFERQQEQYGKNSVSIEAELLGKQFERDSIKAAIAALPDGPMKTENINRLTKIEYSILLLQTRKTNYGSVALIEKHYEIQRVQRELEETAAFISEIEVHKSTL